MNTTYTDILSYIADNPGQSCAQIATGTNRNHQQVYRALYRAKEKGWISNDKPAKGGHQNFFTTPGIYNITDEGLNAIVHNHPNPTQ